MNPHEAIPDPSGQEDPIIELRLRYEESLQRIAALQTMQERAVELEQEDPAGAILRSRLGRCDTELLALRDRYQEAQQRIAALQGVEQRVTQLGAERDSARAEADRLRQIVSELAGAVDRLATEAASLLQGVDPGEPRPRRRTPWRR